MCHDSDKIAYGNLTTVIDDTWPRKQYCPINMSTPATEAMPVSLPIYYHFHKYGWCVIHWRAAVLGYDIFPEESGLASIGRVTLLQSFNEFSKESCKEAQGDCTCQI